MDDHDDGECGDEFEDTIDTIIITPDQCGSTGGAVEPVSSNDEITNGASTCGNHGCRSSVRSQTVSYQYILHLTCSWSWNFSKSRNVMGMACATKFQVK